MDSVAVPMPHFGAILPWKRFQTVADSGNALEFKSFRHPEHTFTG